MMSTCKEGQGMCCAKCMAYSFFKIDKKGGTMKYYKKPDVCVPVFGKSYKCDHKLYDWCTLYEQEGVGLAVIQQRYDPNTKKSWWSAIDPWLANDIFLNPKFYDYFKKVAAAKDISGCYPTATVRQIMRVLGMPPLEKEFWETRF